MEHYSHKAYSDTNCIIKRHLVKLGSASRPLAQSQEDSDHLTQLQPGATTTQNHDTLVEGHSKSAVEHHLLASLALVQRSCVEVVFGEAPELHLTLQALLYGKGLGVSSLVSLSRLHVE